MRTSIYLALVLWVLLCLPMSSAFSATDYLYKTENKTSLTIENFTFVDVNYQLVKIKGVEIFLLKNGEPVKDQNEITSALHYYYSKNYGPTEAELNELDALLEGYNLSRNDGGRWKGKEEYECRRMLLLDGVLRENSKGIYCTVDNEEGCERIAGALYYSAGHTQNIKQVVPFKDFYTEFKKFALDTNTVEEKMTNILKLMDNLNDDNIKQTMDQIKIDINTVQSVESEIESNVFRVPRAGDKADLDLCKVQNNKQGCLAVCPDFSYNETKLLLAEEKIAQLLNKSGPLADYQKISASLLTNTNDRILYRDGEEKAGIYTAKFAPLKAEGLSAIQTGEQTNIYVNDKAFKEKVSQLKDLHNKINTSISKRNFSTIDEDLNLYVSMTEYVSNQSMIVMSSYNDAMNSKNTLDALIFATESKKTLPLEVENEVGDILNESFALNAKFTKGLTPEEYSGINEGYMNLTSHMAETMQKQQEFIALSKFRSLARKINGGVYDMALSTSMVKPEVLSSNAKYIPPVISIISLVSLSALVILAYIAFFSWIKPHGGVVYIYYFVLILLLGGILVFSSGLYLYLKGTTSNADLQEFMISMNNEQNVSVVLEMASAPDTAVVSMTQCASKLKKALNEGNRTVVIYENKSGACTIQSGNETKKDIECHVPLDKPSFVFQYATVQSKPSFSAIFDKKAYLSGDEQYYEACQIAAVFE